MLWLTLTLIAPAAAQDTEELEQRAAELVERRAAIERIAHEMDLEREAQLLDVRRLVVQRNEIELEIERAESRLETLRQQRDQLLAEQALRIDEVDTLEATLLSVADQLESWVDESLPFRTDQRRAALEDIRQELRGGDIEDGEALSRLWQFVEDELALCHDSNLTRSPLALQGQRELVEVVRLGMVTMLFQSQSGRVGHAVRVAGDFELVWLEDEATIDAVSILFDAMRRQIRQGFFSLPIHPLVTM